MKGKKQIMVYYMNNSNELYHYGVKGMKWGVRHDPERSSNGRSHKGMSTAKKVAIGIGVAAAVGGLAYVGIKTGKARQIKTGMNIVKMSRVTVNQRKLTGHSRRLTKHGANGYRQEFYTNHYNRAAAAGRYHDVGRYGQERQKVREALPKDFYSGKTKYYSTGSIKKLQRKTPAVATFQPKYVGSTYTDNNGQLIRQYGNRAYRIRRG